MGKNPSLLHYQKKNPSLLLKGRTSVRIEDSEPRTMQFLRTTKLAFLPIKEKPFIADTFFHSCTLCGRLLCHCVALFEESENRLKQCRTAKHKMESLYSSPFLSLTEVCPHRAPNLSHLTFVRISSQPIVAALVTVYEKSRLSCIAR